MAAGLFSAGLMDVLVLLVNVAMSVKTIEFNLAEDELSGYVLGNLRQMFNVAHASDITLVRQGITGAKYFSYDNVMGNLKAKMTLDRDNMCAANKLCCERQRDCLVELKFVVKPLQVRYVQVRIQDRNDHKPQFSKTDYTMSVSEKAETGHRIRLPLAEDIDSLDYSVKNYELRSLTNEQDSAFILDTETVAAVDEQSARIKAIYLQLKRSLDRETRQKYEYELRAIDGGMPALTGSTTLTVTVQDENDNYPKFDQPGYQVEVEENRLTRNCIKQVNLPVHHYHDLSHLIFCEHRQISFHTGHRKLWKSTDFAQST